VTVTPQNRTILEAEIERFKARLRSGLLDAIQARTASVELAEARAELDEYDWSTITRSVTGAASPSAPGRLSTSRAGWSSRSTDPGTWAASRSARFLSRKVD
jgi:hypothetical protein